MLFMHGLSYRCVARLFNCYATLSLLHYLWETKQYSKRVACERRIWSLRNAATLNSTKTHGEKCKAKRNPREAYALLSLAKKKKKNQLVVADVFHTKPKQYAPKFRYGIVLKAPSLEATAAQKTRWPRRHPIGIRDRPHACKQEITSKLQKFSKRYRRVHQKQEKDKVGASNSSNSRPCRLHYSKQRLTTPFHGQHRNISMRRVGLWPSYHIWFQPHFLTNKYMIGAFPATDACVQISFGRKAI